MIHTSDNSGWSGESIAVADTWEGPYRVTVGNEQVANLPHSQEDPFMWQDSRLHYHVLYHKMFDPPGGGPCGIWAGGHSFSQDGTSWSPIYRAYNTSFKTTDGGVLVAQRRERPKLIFNADHIPSEYYFAWQGVCARAQFLLFLAATSTCTFLTLSHCFPSTLFSAPV